MIPVRLTDAPFDPVVETARFVAAYGDAGAIATFTGQVREAAAGEPALTALTLEGYRGMTLASMQAARTNALARFAITDAAIVHRTGRMVVGEPIVFVAAAATHRRAAFDAVDWLMDHLKSRVILWKMEERADGSKQWIEPTAADAAALVRWEQQ